MATEMLSKETIDEMSLNELFMQVLSLYAPGFDHIERAYYLALMRVRAKDLGAEKQFEKLLKDYRPDSAERGGVTLMSWQPFELQCGVFSAGDDGVWMQVNRDTNVKVSATPIMPIARLRNEETNTEAVQLQYGPHRFAVVPRSLISTTQKIVQLADNGIDVTSESAKGLIRYLSECLTLNDDVLPVYSCVGHMGWIGDGADFVPYCDAKFDAEREYGALFRSVATKGDYSAWVDYVGGLRQNNDYIQIMLAASFASALVKPCGCLPFILHLFGKSGAGKTVSLMVAMSIWGDPEQGKLVRSLNMTGNSMMSTAACLGSIPFAGDELQTIKERWGGNYDDIIMRLCEGSDRGRMSGAALMQTKTWNNSFLFTGEEPCLRDTSGAGAKNRVLQIELKHDLISEGNRTANFVRANHGHAGKAFVQYAQKLGSDELLRRYNEIVADIIKNCDTTDKQAMAAALVILADQVADEAVWLSGKALSVKDLKPYLQSVKEVDTAARAYHAMLSIIGRNAMRFERYKGIDCRDYPSHGEVWGRIQEDENVAYVNRDVVREQLAAKNFELDAVKNDWIEAGYIERAPGANIAFRVRLHGIRTYCIKIKLLKDDENWTAEPTKPTEATDTRETAPPVEAAEPTNEMQLEQLKVPDDFTLSVEKMPWED